MCEQSANDNWMDRKGQNSGGTEQRDCKVMHI